MIALRHPRQPGQTTESCHRASWLSRGSGLQSMVTGREFVGTGSGFRINSKIHRADSSQSCREGVEVKGEQGLEEWTV